MEILVISDIHNDVENLMGFLDKLSKFHFDVIVCPGDITDYTVPKGFSRTDIAKIVLEELKTLKKPVLMLPGNQDKEIIPFLEKEGVSLHGKGIVIQGVGFYGYGGAKTPFNTPLEPSEQELKTGLNKAYEMVKTSKVKVQVTHIPPMGTKIDRIFSGAHIGSEVVRKFIEEKNPAAAISSHVTEAKGIDEIGNTKIINTGKFPEGYCGFITINNKEVSLKIVNLI